MAMPLNLVLVRHGQSEGNVAQKQSKLGDHSVFDGEFAGRHTSEYRLSDLGREQAKLTGEWLRKEFPEGFTYMYTSEYARAAETAAILGIHSGRSGWLFEPHLRERSWGDIEHMSKAERERLYPESMKQKELNPFYWTPPNGESIAQLCLRIERMMDTISYDRYLGRPLETANVLVVCHGEVMTAFRALIERLSVAEYNRLEVDPAAKMHNCQVLHYTRYLYPKDEGDARRPFPWFCWKRWLCPCKPETEQGDFQKMERPCAYSNEELLEMVERHEPILR